MVASFAVGVLAYPSMPEQMIVRWHVGLDMTISVDRMAKPVALFIAPTVAAALFAALHAVPSIAGGAAAARSVRPVFETLAAGVAALLLLVELALVYLN